MGLVTKQYLECDRCGATEPTSGREVAFDAVDGHPGWIRVSDDRFLCPKCSPGYETLLARHRVELEDYIEGKE